MNASSFITLGTYMLQQNGIRLYKGLYIAFKAAYSVTFDLLILKIMFLFFKNTVKILKFR